MTNQPDQDKAPASSQPAAEKPATGMTRRKAIGKIITYAGILGLGRYADNVADSALTNYENTERRNGLPLRKADITGQTPNRLVDSLVEKGFTGFMFGDGHHQSAPVIKTITAMADPKRHVFETFLEMPEAGKGNEQTNEALELRDSVEGVDANKVRSEFTRNISAEKGKAYATDSWRGPDHRNVGRMIKCAKGDLYTMLAHGLPNLRGMVDGMNRDMVYRNTNMAEAITRVMQDQPRDKLFAFIVGDGHLNPSAPDTVTRRLQASLPDRKIAVISTIPVKDQKFDQRVFSDSNNPNHFIITAFDKDKGLNVTPDGHIDWNGEHLLLNSRQQGIRKE